MNEYDDNETDYIYTPLELLSFLKGRFNYAGCSHSVTLEYAKDIEKTLKSIEFPSKFSSDNTVEMVNLSDVDNAIHYFEETLLDRISMSPEEIQEYHKHLINIKALFNNFPFEN